MATPVLRESTDHFGFLVTRKWELENKSGHQKTKVVSRILQMHTISFIVCLPINETAGIQMSEAGA